MSDLNMDAMAESHYAAQDPQFEPEITLDDDKWHEDLNEIYEEAYTLFLRLRRLHVEFETSKGRSNRNLIKGEASMDDFLEFIEREL